MQRKSRCEKTCDKSVQGFNLTAMMHRNKDVYDAFKTVCYAMGKSATDVMVDFMKSYVQEHAAEVKSILDAVQSGFGQQPGKGEAEAQ